MDRSSTTCGGLLARTSLTQVEGDFRRAIRISEKAYARTRLTAIFEPMHAASVLPYMKQYFFSYQRASSQTTWKALCT